uniref:Receptor-like serine/threonine-protein kinase n=1 Tax=Nelumbo nucifera TaxID=4432 RepID=A0A822XS22_NELNU|nr:TPA_asm: hypothetical protein HUJ06_024600 [Nelumbo nucifera]
MKIGCGNYLTSLFLIISVYLSSCCIAIDTITPTQYIRNSETIISAGGKFKLGFFSPSNSTSRYVGIWYNTIPGQTIVWVANRENPTVNASGVLMIADDGNLVVRDGSRHVLWSTNVSNIANANTSAQLSDYGNLVLRAASSSGNGNTNNGILWESFEHPLDSFLTTMKIGVNLRTGDKRTLTSRKSDSDPSPGNFSLGVIATGIPQVAILKGSLPYWVSGPWNNRIFIGIPAMSSIYISGLNLVRDDTEGTVYVMRNVADIDESYFIMFKLDSDGLLVERQWDEGKNEWVSWAIQKTECDTYGKCGPFGSCDASSSPICTCLEGFTPKSPEEWSMRNWSSGCIRRTSLLCERNNTAGEEGKADGFLRRERMKVPDFAIWSAAIDVKACEEQCLKNCSCVAFAFDSGIGCMSWNGSLIDIQKFSAGGIDLYIRLAHSEIGCKNGRSSKMLLSDVSKSSGEVLGADVLRDRIKHRKSSELTLFKFEDLAKATDNFDSVNKLGKGGFGLVYKGKLQGGQHIAVKRLSKSSEQGLEEFKNEVMVISSLQHRNLVKLLGCCIEGGEKMLIYEFMSNRSLDAFLFDATKRALLDWRKRFHIIEGIGRGLLYLHRDSRLKIIHRDLKASNILLDEELNPKISDFGMARILGGTQEEERTRRVVGTYGYMSPEYVMQGNFSEKSDVFSFGVLLLEIVSGKRNTSFFHHQEYVSLLDHTWKLWNENKLEDFIEPTLCEPCIQPEILRCIHVGLLCVQEFPKDRPTMSTVVSMLSSEIAILPTPKHPAFTERQILLDKDPCQDNQYICSTNVTITTLNGR